MAFRWFAHLCGYPSVCWSDHGTNFVGAQGYLNEPTQTWDIPEVKSVLSKKFGWEFRWEWNTSHVSHQNKAVETLIKSVRQALNTTCMSQASSEEQWRTFLSEVTYMVNRWPLYPSSEDIQKALMVTLNDLLIGHYNPPPQPEPEETPTFDNYSEARKTESLISEEVGWSILPQTFYRDNIQTGDLVLEMDPDLNGTYLRHLPWKQWPCPKSENQDKLWRVQQTYSQTVLDCDKGRAQCRTTLV